MDLKKRTFAKAMTWQITGFFMMIAIGFFTTGSLNAAGGMAVAAFLTGTISYVLHERIWQRISWGRLSDVQSHQDPP
ncbi:DUF2061 domain-containing protein [Sulfitobacter sp. M57]|uniref:DUF2061 domain-containing protein n=1 Tax=unclassified Sulfitobacter TaxID=196795 RepID=UPI0023E114B7|nr:MULTISPECIES: DUF2061 domain-containing protein [unclassified Sulfitobacter]MDF3414392.1 DUF2061 domain-containing protein [Sulfitobacter sp. KE5]MDF3420326.1 DUF2061 domain-containing protein [Sulfitobacter sp. KE43]MDF3432938.1 DUF2061 domain-containing protein [Sulfitobacter sp. KE42]MDF3458578.1 DUF2061 domain-containing protein [Sulfitobacter sp. S74]MDF3462478.1 DUF2061 domain-containing protein [Sulfitobacter sp. Ks18]